MKVIVWRCVQYTLSEIQANYNTFHIILASISLSLSLWPRTSKRTSKLTEIRSNKPPINRRVLKITQTHTWSLTRCMLMHMDVLFVLASKRWQNDIMVKMCRIPLRHTTDHTLTHRETHKTPTLIYLHSEEKIAYRYWCDIKYIELRIRTIETKKRNRGRMRPLTVHGYSSNQYQFMYHFMCSNLMRQWLRCKCIGDYFCFVWNKTHLKFQFWHFQHVSSNSREFVKKIQTNAIRIGCFRFYTVAFSTMLYFFDGVGFSPENWTHLKMRLTSVSDRCEISSDQVIREQISGNEWIHCNLTIFAV